MTVPLPGDEAVWLRDLDVPLLRRLVGRRAIDFAVTHGLRYLQQPTLVKGTVHAVLAPPDAREGRDAAVFRVTVRVDPSRAELVCQCSRCLSAFGACVHIATLAVDLACSAPMREALLKNASTTEACARALAIRRTLDLEQKFDGRLRAWLAPTTSGLPIEIAATPLVDADGYVLRGYGDRTDAVAPRSLSVFVRRAGERKLLSPRETLTLDSFGRRDRSVLRHTKERGSGRKTVIAAGIDASLTIEAMRAHGRIFTAGFKHLLRFRSAHLRPEIVHASGAEGELAADSDALTAVWVTEDGTTRISFDDAVFFAGPFPYVWTKGGAIYRVAPEVDLDLAAQLVEAPMLLVPPGKLRDTGARLLRATRGRGVRMPPSEVFGLPPIETPRVVLRLAGEPLRIEGELLAIYGAREVPLFGDGDPGEGLVRSDDDTRDGRDLDTEARARALVARAGIVRQRAADAEADDADDESNAEASGDAAEETKPTDEVVGPPAHAIVAASGEAAVAFWHEGLLALRAAQDPSVDVELSQRLARVRVGAPITGRLHVVLEGDWLDTRLEFASKDLPVELDAIRTALARKERWVTLDDGTLARISSSVETLADEAMEVLGRTAHARLPAHQLGRIDRWAEENDGRIDDAVAKLRSRLRALAVAPAPDFPRGLEGTLRPYQALGLAWLQFLQALGAGGILADDMGLGKTITTLAFLARRKELEGPAPTLVVCPTSVATNWVREAARFTPDLSVILLHGAAAARARVPIAAYDVVVTTYALLRRDVETLAPIPFRCFVLDEAQNVKNADAATRRAAARLDASMRLALTGTPIENRLRELWSIASLVNPGMLGTARNFERRFERPIATDRKSPAADELRAIIRPFLLRRTKVEVLGELPPKTEVDRIVTLQGADKRMYDALAHTLRESLARDVEKRGAAHLSLNVFTALTRLRQMACDPRLVDKRLPGSRSAKREAFLDLVHELVAEGRRALVFSQFVELLTLWRKDLDEEGIAYDYLDGSTRNRDAVVSSFQEGTAPLFLISLKAGGAGLNLTAADTVIHCDPWWNPAVEDQATDRAYRIGQDKPVTVVRLLARGTIEEKMLSLKAKKRELVSVIIGDTSRALEGITEDDLRLLLGDVDVDDDIGGDLLDAVDGPPRPTDMLADGNRVLDRAFDTVVDEVQRWLRTTGRTENELASRLDLPLPYAFRLAHGEPFPCSRAVAERIRTRLRAW